MTPRTVRIASGVVIAAWAALGAAATLLLLPRTLAPTTSLPEAYAAIAAIGDLGRVVPWPLLVLVLGIGLAVLVTRRPATGTRERGPLVPLLAIAALTFLWALADFPMGLWLSNHLPPFEGGLSPLGEVYGRIGAVAAAAAVVAQAVAVGRRRRSAALR